MKWDFSFTDRKHLLKLIALFLAVVAWFYVVGSAQIRMDKSVKVIYRLPDHMALSGIHTRRVTYSIKGPRGFVKALRKRDDELVIDIKKIYEPNVAHYRFDVKNLGLDFPFGVEIEKVEPKFIEVALDKKVSRNLPVKVQLAGELLGAHELVQSSYEPTWITVTGAQNVVEKLEHVQTDAIHLAKLKGSGVEEVGFTGIDHNLTLSDKQVRFNYEVRSTRSNIVLKGIPITFMTTQLVRHVNRRSVSIMVLGSETSPKELDSKLIRVIAEIPPGARGVIAVELKAQLPDGYELMEINPKIVTVTMD